MYLNPIINLKCHHHILMQEDGWKLSRNNYYQEGWLEARKLSMADRWTDGSSHKNNLYVLETHYKSKMSSSHINAGGRMEAVTEQ